MTKHPIFQILALQAAFGLIVAGAIFMGEKADARCKKPTPKNCHPAPAYGPGAMICDQPERVTPWNPVRRCEAR